MSAFIIGILLWRFRCRPTLARQKNVSSLQNYIDRCKRLYDRTNIYSKLGIFKKSMHINLISSGLNVDLNNLYIYLLSFKICVIEESTKRLN